MKITDQDKKFNCMMHFVTYLA